MKKIFVFLAFMTVMVSAISSQFIRFSGEPKRCPSNGRAPNTYDLGPIDRGATLTLRLEFPEIPLGLTLPSVFTPTILGSDLVPTSSPPTDWTEMNVPAMPSNITLSWGPLTRAGKFYL